MTNQKENKTENKTNKALAVANAETLAMWNEQVNNQATLIKNAIKDKGLQVFNLTNVNTINELTGIVKVADFASQTTLLAQAKALAKIRDIFKNEKKANTERNKNRKQGEVKCEVSIYGCATYIEYCEQYLNIAKATANTTANIANLIDNSGMHTIYFDFVKPLDFGFTQLMKMISLWDEKAENDKLTPLIKDGTIKPTMSVREIADIVKKVQTANEGVKVEDTTDNAEDTTDNAEDTTDENAKCTILLDMVEVEVIKIVLKKYAEGLSKSDDKNDKTLSDALKDLLSNIEKQTK